MIYVYLASLMIGLLLAVRIMIYGVERPREDNPTGERSFRVSPPVIVAFAIAFGIAGYALRRTGEWMPFVIAAVLGAAAAVAAARLVTRWWTITPEHDIDDERYVLQGHLARVTKTVGPTVDGEVAFDIGAQHRVVRARNLVEAEIAAGTEVVIERIDGGIAYVEAWAEVEKRL